MHVVGKIAARHSQGAWLQATNFARPAAQAAAQKAAEKTGIAVQAAQAEPARAVQGANNLQETAPAHKIRVGKIDRSHLPQNVQSVSFDDLVDTLNPLQHLPVIGDIYRKATGDQLSGMARVAGGFLFGGVLGGMMGMAGQTFEESHDGHSMGEIMVADIFGKDTGQQPVTMLASNMHGKLAQFNAPHMDDAAGAQTTMLAEAAPQEKEIKVAEAAAAQQTAYKPAVQAARQPPLPHATKGDYLPALPKADPGVIDKVSAATGNKIDPATLGAMMQESAKGVVASDMKAIEGMAQLAAGAGVPASANMQKFIPDMMSAALDKYRQNAYTAKPKMPHVTNPLTKF